MPQQPEIIVTKDGSHTLKSAVYHAEYHSVHGAIQESIHVFINAGLHQYLGESTIRVFEMGLGTGLNAFLTLLETEKHQLKVDYTTLETYPIDLNTANQLNYLELLGATDKKAEFEKIHTSEFEKPVDIGNYFTFTKHNKSLLEFDFSEQYHVIYFDAFAPNDQPELWTVDVFKKLFDNTLPNGMLLTYCAKGDVKRALQSAGWTVQKLPGPPGKREMIRAIKPQA